MEIPDSLSERFPVLDVLEQEWEAVSRPVFMGWLAFYVLLIGNALFGGHLFQWFDLVFIPIHEGGHLLFRMFGEFIMVAGGTFLQLFVPFALAVYFAFRRQVPGTTFCAFFFFEQFLPISIYMADARAQELPLLTVGDSDDVIHDWFYLFSHTGLLEHDTQIGGAFRFLGWLGMLATVGLHGVHFGRIESADGLGEELCLGKIAGPKICLSSDHRPVSMLICIYPSF